MTTGPEELADRLEAIAEQLSDMGIEVLREALEATAETAAADADLAEPADTEPAGTGLAGTGLAGTGLAGTGAGSSKGKAAKMPPEYAKREKEIARARNAVLKAANLLRSLG